jgi:glycosyltransferase involved in cell wall biosynthesis
MKSVMFSANSSWFIYNFRRKVITVLISKGYRVYCLSSRDEYSEKLTELGAINLFSPALGKGMNPFHEFYCLIKIFYALFMNRPDFIFNSTIKNNLYVGTIAILLNIKYSNNVSGLGTVFLHDKLIFKLVKYWYGIVNRFSHSVLFENQDDLNLFVVNGFAKKSLSRCLPGSGVDINEFPFSPLRLKTKKDFVFLMVARVIADKGVREFIEAAEIVASKYPDSKFILLGPYDVSNTSSIRQNEILNWKNNSVVDLVGKKSNVFNWLEDCDFFVLPSYREGLPKSVLEAASVGRPAIVTDVPGCRQSIIDGKTGWLCKVKDARSLALVMETAINCKPEQLKLMSLNARDRVVNSFSDELVVKVHLDLLCSLNK